MKKNNKLTTIVSVLIIVFLFAVAITIVIAGYNFIQEFSEIGKENSAELLVVALKGLSTIAIGIFILILVGILIFDNSIKELKDNVQVGFKALYGSQHKIIAEETDINKFLVNNSKVLSFIEDNELLKKEISAKNDNIKGLLYKIEALDEECSAFEDKIAKLQDELKSIKNAQKTNL